MAEMTLVTPESASFVDRQPPIVKAFTAALTSDDIESLYGLFAPDAVWVIMATGETFAGIDKIKELAARSIAARTHEGGLGVSPKNIFCNAEGTMLCWEYLHTAVATDKWPSSRSRPTAGVKLEAPIVLVCEVLRDKLQKVREYFDLLTVVEPGVPHRLYS
jgi:ketosteroid isomerase-like protein